MTSTLLHWGNQALRFKSWNRTLPHVVVNHCGAHKSFPQDFTVIGLESRGQASSGNSWYMPPTTPAQNTDLNWVPVPHSTEHCEVNVTHCQDFPKFVLSSCLKIPFYHPFAMLNCKSEVLIFLAVKPINLEEVCFVDKAIFVEFQVKMTYKMSCS